MASIAVTPASPIGVLSAVRVNVTAADTNDSGNEDLDAYPIDPEIQYYLLFDNPDGDDGKSYVFSPSQDGKHEFNDYVFPNAGSWVVRLKDASDDSEVATANVTVQ